jgi:hypothetical protein
LDSGRKDLSAENIENPPSARKFSAKPSGNKKIPSGNESKPEGFESNPEGNSGYFDVSVHH